MIQKSTGWGRSGISSASLSSSASPACFPSCSGIICRWTSTSAAERWSASNSPPTPDADRIRAAIDKAGLKDARIQQPYGPAANNEVLITLSRSETSESALDQGRATIVSALTQNYAR